MYAQGVRSATSSEANGGEKLKSSKAIELLDGITLGSSAALGHSVTLKPSRVNWVHEG